MHVRELGLESAQDIVLFRLAAYEERVMVSGDSDFGTLLALSGEDKYPSVVLFRKANSRRSAALLAQLQLVLLDVESALNEGAIVVILPDRVRIRRLPLR